MTQKAGNKGQTFELRIRCDWCKACGYCIAACPQEVLEFSDELNVRGVHPVVAAHPDRCTGCRTCVVVCPDVVIEVYKDGTE
jgi:2-oxoglutarate ferredoxin oxidoreductase subunit delta